ncbi:DUF2188 domain-containing protein [Novosphingobium mangrovi (ex Huang et al. 2023)]|uniref:DUF2188 domain-containing protein n=1 Tax=Novosphingobium mangrovi (ex Huang et al. 2023) TaxID=2976432 RepID=A0ABT2IB58_9SPHN|nr:DUF2188 domain-containing protein [Novosphingobium mangrovi (ex Huang et al. 2023)]MCT2402039.1 DUF2188 domain-containing protein [Novosphingobium mangrovi (ex Huang et al. 2023)]
MADNDRMVYRRASDQKWIDKRNGASRGFVHDTQAAAAAGAKQHLLNSGGGDLSIKGLNGQIRSKDTIGRPDPLPPRDKEH